MSQNKKSKDEVVDGAKVAAQILSRMGGEAKERIIQAISQVEPELVVKIQENMFRFDDLVDVAPKGLQRLLAEVKHEDVVLSLKKASIEVKQVLLDNMSQRKRELVEGDVKTLPPTRKTEVDEAQRRILAKVEELRAAGVLQTQSKNDVWA